MKKNTFSIKAFLLLIVCPVFIMAQCEDDMIGSEPANTPVNNFEYFWKTFDTHYGMFEVKNIDWQNQYNEFRPRVNNQMSDQELYNLFSEMIIHFNDNHLNLYPTNGELPVFPGGVLSYRNGTLKIRKTQDDYDLEVCKKYVQNYKQVTENIGFGSINGQIGYINIKGTDKLKVATKEMTAIVKTLSSTSGIIIDVRGFYGGFDAVSQSMAGFFATSKKLYMTTRKRNGANHNDFTSPLDWYVQPHSEITYQKPVVLLTSRFTQSAGETFTLALKQFEQVKTLGDTTAGSFSDNPNFELPNGWIFSVSVGDYRAPGNTSYEGIGIGPDEYFINSRQDLLNEKDKTLEKALQKLK
jgi:carboxyl-terminal processing protease